ncbi:MAG: response regulator, partial [Rhodothermales bacterium]|nr:response regulator [Rhodothermales bacterium]
SSRRKHEGSGIGLSLARELMELHGGTIRADSIPGRGSTFTAVLPLMTGNGMPAFADLEPEAHPDHFVAATGPVKANGLADPQSDRTRILVVDDNADVRRFVRSLLDTEYVVFEAADGVEGLDRARAELPDLIVADVMMPRLDGFELSRALKEEPMLAGVPVILLTARAAVEDELEGLGTGADHYVRKPFEPDVLLARVKNLLDGRTRLRALYSSEPAKGGAEQSAFVAALFDVIDRNMTDSRFSVEMMAEQMALSPSQLRRRTKDELGKSPNELIRERRLDRAAELLQQGAGSVSEIGFAVGFNSLNYFSRSYSAHFGAPPSAHLTQATRL